VLRPLEPDDVDVVREIFDGLGPASRQQRFLVPKSMLTHADLLHLTTVDHRDHEAVTALTVDGRPLGVARLIRGEADPRTAEVAIAVVDAWHARGLGTLLARTLVSRARELGIGRFSLFVSRDNRAAVRLIRRVLGDTIEVIGADRGTVEVMASLDDVAEGAARRVARAG
jgi:RimJ/RimL family protein N-acetyltransferase